MLQTILRRVLIMIPPDDFGVNFDFYVGTIDAGDPFTGT